jgi:hypothetical protein
LFYLAKTSAHGDMRTTPVGRPRTIPNGFVWQNDAR